METFFPDDSPLRYWLCNATVSQVACSVSWPPVIAVTGYAPCVRAWAPSSRDEPEFRPVQQLREVDGERFVAATVRGDLLVAADASSSGRIGVWDTATWTRQQTLTANAPVTALAASRTFIAAGTAAGTVRVWRRQSAADTTFAQFFAPDLQLDRLPVTCVQLGPLRPHGAGGGGGGGVGGGSDDVGSSGSVDAVMVVHTRGNGRVSAWRLSDAKILGSLGRSGAPDSPAALLSANVLHAVLARDVLLTVSWLPGSDPLLQWINPVQRAGGEVPGIGPHLAGLSRPASCDYDGNVIVMGCDDGTLWVWGLLQPPSSACHQQQQQQPQSSADGAHNTSTDPGSQPAHWRGYHRGAVGAVACLPHRGQIASAGADGFVKLWSLGGCLVAVTRLGWQPTALAVNEGALVVGGAAGHIQILVLLTEEQAATATSRPTEAERLEAATPPEAAAVAEYAYWFDARSLKAATSAGSSSSGGGGDAGLWGLVSEHPDAFAAFVPPLRQVTLGDLGQQQHHMGPEAAGPPGGGGGGGNEACEPRPAAATAAAGSDGEAAGGGGGVKASSFDMRAALQGAQRSAADQAAASAAEAAAKRVQLRAMGEGPGVARSSGSVQLEGATSALGRKCASPSCMQREGLVALRQQQGARGGGGFKRCGACKSAFYCSAHCQSTHWRDGHKRECPQLAEAWRRHQQQQQQLEQELEQRHPEQEVDWAGADAGAPAGTNSNVEGGGGGGSRPRQQVNGASSGDASSDDAGPGPVGACGVPGGRAAAVGGRPAAAAGEERRGGGGPQASCASVMDSLYELD